MEKLSLRDRISQAVKQYPNDPFRLAQVILLPTSFLPYSSWYKLACLVLAASFLGRQVGTS